MVDTDAAPEVLHRTVVAPDLGSLLSGWDRLPDGWAAVTLAGDLADARGVVTVRGRAGDGARPTSRSARLAELTSLTDRLAGESEEVRRQLASAQAELAQATVTADAATAALEAARIARRQSDEDAGAAERVHAHLVVEGDRLGSALAALPPLEKAPERPVELATELTALEAAASDARNRRAAADAERDAAREAWQQAVQAADEQDAAAGDRRASAARIAERGEQLERAIARITSERDALANGIREAADALAEATTAEAAASDARTAGEEAREAARQALLDAERQLGGGAGRVTELEAQQQQVVADLSRLDEALAGLERERELSLEGLPELAADDAGTTRGPV